MMTRRRMAAASGAVALAALTVTSIFADSRTTARRSMMREGPGAFYPVVTRVDPGTGIDVLKTSGQWLEGRVLEHRGWLPQTAFDTPRAGDDYAGLLHGGKAMLVSSVDLAAATKGAFEATYAEKNKVSFDVVNQLDALVFDPALVATLAGTLRDTLGSGLYGRIPVREFKNDLVLKPDAETMLGRAFAAQLMKAPLIADTARLAYVNGIAAIVGAKTQRYDLGYKVAVLQDPSVNGFGLPGGYLILTSGFLDLLHDEAELACALGHEMAHASLYHGLREFSKRDIHRRRDATFDELDELSAEAGGDSAEDDLSRLADKGYLRIIGARAREDEFEADIFGVAYAAAAGYDPRAWPALLERVSGHAADGDDFRHHPPLTDRIAAVNQAIQRHRLVKSDQQRLPERFTHHLARAAAGDVTTP